MTTAPSALNAIPQEVLEHIAFFSTNDTFLGPPSGLIPLLLTSRSIYSRLSLDHHLYARIYASKFDIGPVIRRIGSNSTVPSALAAELPKRFQILKRIRDRLYSLLEDDDEDDHPMSHDLIFLAYSMMLENEGKNERQLRDYAKIDPWLRDYWFHERGASRVVDYLSMEGWVPETPFRSMAMWLFWFILRPNDHPKDNQESWKALNIFKVFALAAHKYELTNPAWHQFVPEPRIPKMDYIEYLSEKRCFVPPPLATPAILSFLTLVNELTEGVGYTTPVPPSHPSSLQQEKLEWECEWQRCVIVGQGDFDNILTDAFRPGSIEGVWEGLFTYTEFTAYAALLAGGDPHVIQESMVVRHRQTWKLHEHHLLAFDASRSDSGIGLDSDSVEPLPSGDPLRSYFPTGTQICEIEAGIVVRAPNRNDVLRYQRASSIGEERQGVPVQDIIITGEGHSAWGEFNLVGRVRPCDGFVSLSKEYVGLDVLLIDFVVKVLTALHRWMETEENGYIEDILSEMTMLTWRDGGVTL
ncbi:hypothetical protein J132_09360 [Termitomyces sp. J132]|nr:hypothetical protein H2248_002813 [Termitomyces sp. 'cryptogamus']KNZ76616.1 hypothetical protein J132_09360 [Termitomyces sp. J132]